MKNLKIGTRLELGFGFVVLLMVIVVGIGISAMNAQNKSADLTLLDIYPIVAMTQEVSYLSVDNSRIVRNLILNKEANALASNKAAFEKNSSRVDEILGILDKKVYTDRGRELLKEIVATRAGYLNYTSQVIELALKNADEEATKALYGENDKSQAAYLAALKNMIAFEEKRMADGSDKTNAAYHSGMTVMISLGVVAVLAGIAVAGLITRGLLKQLGGEPDYATAITGKIAMGDLTVDIAIKHHDESSLLFAIRGMRDNLANIVGQVRSGTEVIANVSGEVASGNLDLSARTEEQASSLEETASSMEELAGTVKQNADSAAHANQLAVSASGIAVKGGSVVSQVVETMGSINASAKKIEDIISVIDGIAFQTNILALNAAVEAARAGEQGRGFAVVAAEVRNLAQRSAAAAKEIKALIGDSVSKVDAGTKLVDEAGVTMAEIVQSIKQVTDIMLEITEASREQSQGIDQINQAITDMENVTQQNAALVEQAAAAAGSMQDQTNSLMQVVSVFKLNSTHVTAAAPKKPANRMAATAQNTVSPVKAVSREPKLPAPIVNVRKSMTTEPAVGDDWEEF